MVTVNLNNPMDSLYIHSFSEWEYQKCALKLSGHGVVPKILNRLINVHTLKLHPKKFLVKYQIIFSLLE